MSNPWERYSMVTSIFSVGQMLQRIGEEHEPEVGDMIYFAKPGYDEFILGTIITVTDLTSASDSIISIPGKKAMYECLSDGVRMGVVPIEIESIALRNG